MIEFSTREYEMAHGKQPRGYGQWAFFLDDDPEPFWALGSFAKAKKMALVYGITKDARRIRVGS